MALPQVADTDVRKIRARYIRRVGEQSFIVVGPQAHYLPPSIL